MNYNHTQSKIIAHKIIESFNLQPLIDNIDNIDEVKIKEAETAVKSCQSKLFLAKLLKLNQIITIKTIQIP